MTSPTTPGPAVDLIEHAAGISVAAMKEPHTAPYRWAGALWEAGMLVAPGTLTPQPASPALDEHTRINTNAGHGYAWKRPDGMLAKCGGPAVCADCSYDQELVHQAYRERMDEEATR